MKPQNFFATLDIFFGLVIGESQQVIDGDTWTRKMFNLTSIYTVCDVEVLKIS